MADTPPLAPTPTLSATVTNPAVYSPQPPINPSYNPFRRAKSTSTPSPLSTPLSTPSPALGAAASPFGQNPLADDDSPALQSPTRPATAKTKVKPPPPPPPPRPNTSHGTDARTLLERRSSAVGGLGRSGSRRGPRPAVPVRQDTGGGSNAGVLSEVKKREVKVEAWDDSGDWGSGWGAMDAESTTATAKVEVPVDTEKNKGEDDERIPPEVLDAILDDDEEANRIKGANAGVGLKVDWEKFTMTPVEEKGIEDAFSIKQKEKGGEDKVLSPLPSDVEVQFADIRDTPVVMSPVEFSPSQSLEQQRSSVYRSPPENTYSSPSSGLPSASSSPLTGSPGPETAPFDPPPELPTTPHTPSNPFRHPTTPPLLHPQPHQSFTFPIATASNPLPQLEKTTLPTSSSRSSIHLDVDQFTRLMLGERVDAPASTTSSATWANSEKSGGREKPRPPPPRRAGTSGSGGSGGIGNGSVGVGGARGPAPPVPKRRGTEK